MSEWETTVNGVRAVVEVRTEDIADGGIAEMVFLVLFNERDTSLYVVAGRKEGSIGPNGCFAEILVGYRTTTSKESFTVPYVDTDVGRVTWDTDVLPPKIQIDPKRTLT